MKLRHEQIEALEASVVPDVEERLLNYFQRGLFKHYCFLGKEVFQQVIKKCRGRAARYGLKAEHELRKFITLAFQLGSNFDQDVQYPWAAAILEAPPPAEPPLKIDRLVLKANDYRTRVDADYRGRDAEGNGTGLIEELRSIRNERNVELSPREFPAFVQRLLPRLQRTFPAKAAYLGPDVLQRLARHGRDLAGKYGINSERGVLLCTALAFAVGSGFDDEPLLPWIPPILTNEALDQDAKVDLLYREGVKTLRAWWGTEGDDARSKP